MDLLYIRKKINAIFGDEKELDVKEFKERSVKLRFGGNDWYEFGKDLEELDILKIKGRKIKLEK